MSQLENRWIGILALLIIWVVANVVMTDRVEKISRRAPPLRSPPGRF